MYTRNNISSIQYIINLQLNLILTRMVKINIDYLVINMYYYANNILHLGEKIIL